jgi:hypothetical protein
MSLTRQNYSGGCTATASLPNAIPILLHEKCPFAMNESPVLKRCQVNWRSAHIGRVDDTSYPARKHGDSTILSAFRFSGLIAPGCRSLVSSPTKLDTVIREKSRQLLTES